jgi:hypothetical protein
MVSLQWFEPSVFAFSCVFGLQSFVSEEGQWLVVSDVSEASPMALISQLVCHNCLVPGFTDGAGSCVVTMS